MKKKRRKKEQIILTRTGVIEHEHRREKCYIATTPEVAEKIKPPPGGVAWSIHNKKR